MAGPGRGSEATLVIGIEGDAGAYEALGQWPEGTRMVTEAVQGEDYRPRRSLRSPMKKRQPVTVVGQRMIRRQTCLQL